MVEANQQLYMDQVGLFLHSALVDLLARALDHGAFSFTDLMTADDFTILTTISSNPALRPMLIDFLTLQPANLRERRDGCHMTSMARLLDPPVRTSCTEVVALSELEPGWHRARRSAERRADKDVRLLTTT